ncbi:glutamyl-tRNA reductase [Planctomyces sp. SH-PL14]|uniref:glutamyl-tRNA reductase n=1 Tax=Planctomyces sp. SH-PL14 TaxID=1632864 RepID=UPI001E2F7A07|nr:glutamyl-tRNA reductase [Planctomyces sp. SH-PL14]
MRSDSACSDSTCFPPQPLSPPPVDSSPLPMNLQVVYCNHQTADLSVRERLAFSSPEKLARAYEQLRGRFPASESVILSTCNRVEVYMAQEDGDGAPTQHQLAQFFSEFHQIPLDEFLGDLLEDTGPQAVRHLFDVACSLDSMVLGETQIVSQVKEAYDGAMRNQANGPLTNTLFQRALTVSGRVRTETKLSEGKISIASVAVGAFAKGIFDRFDDKTVLILGAGEMATETLRYLQGEGVRQVLVCNRSLERAERLAAEFAGIARPWSELDDCLALADVIVSTTGADRPVVDVPRFRAVRRRTGSKPVFILDLGAPRDFDPQVEKIDSDIYLFDIDNLEKTCETNRKSRAGEIERARQIVDEETARFLQDVYHKATGPIIKRLREHWHEISRQELDQLFKKLGPLEPGARDAIERSVERIVNKLLHPPLETLRHEAKEGTPHGLLDAIRRLFRLND